MTLETTGYVGAYNPLLDPMHMWGSLTQRRLAAALTQQALGVATFANITNAFGMPLTSYLQTTFSRYLSANADLMSGLVREYSKPEFGLDTTVVDGVTVPVNVQVEVPKPFGDLIHFKRDLSDLPVSKQKRNDPKVLVLAPMSGHYATLLRPTVERLLPHAEVYITDWRSARQVPLGAGSFDLQEYADYVQQFVRHLGPETHVIAICQSTVPSVMAVSRIAEDSPEAQPMSLTLMAGPLDPSAAPTDVTELADKMNLPDYLQTFIARTPGGRKVYPGYVQLASFIAMNPESHFNSQRDLYRHYVTDRTNPDVSRIEKFYNEYFAVADLPAEFYAETVDKVFIKKELANGTMTYRGRLVRPELVTCTVVGVEGSKDDISAPGQTKNFLSKFENADVLLYEQEGAGHYGVFAGGLWRGEIAPRVLGVMHDVAKSKSVRYSEKFSGPKVDALA